MCSHGHRSHLFVLLALLAVVAALSRPVSASPSFVAFEKIAVAQAQSETEPWSRAKRLFGYHFPPRLGKPSPYIVLVPGCHGLVSAARDTLFAYAQRLVREGYGAVVIDIFRGTELTQTCDRDTGPSRALAALSAARFAKSTGYSSGRFGIVGQGQGGTAASGLSGDLMRSSALYGGVEDWFDAAVAFFPECRRGALSVPLLILTGGRDDRTPASECLHWHRSGNSANLAVRFYPNAAHGLDLFSLQPGRELNHHVINMENAAQDAVRRMIDFFDEHLW